jgi:hypothetical protein
MRSVGSVGAVLTARSEHIEQREFVSWFRRTFSARIFAIPNGGNRGLVTAGRLKVEGVTAGVPDLCVPEWSLWIEMKTASRSARCSPSQLDWHKYLESIGHTVMVPRGCADAIDKLREFGRKAEKGETEK